MKSFWKVQRDIALLSRLSCVVSWVSEYGTECLIHACFEAIQDRVTRTLQSLVTELNRINKTRSGKAMQRAQRDESKALQILTAEYLREKGAPKVCVLSFSK